MSDKLEFASPEWLDALKELLPQYAAKVPELQLSLCEVFTAVPRHLDRDHTGTIAWHCKIASGTVEFFYSEAEECDWKTVVDYASILPIARWVIEPDNLEEYRALIAQTLESGKMRQSGDVSRIPQLFQRMHNDLAVRTL